MLSATSTSTNQCIRLGRRRGESTDGDEPKTTTVVVPSTVQSTVGFPDDFLDPRMKIGQVFGVQVNFPNCWMQLLGNETRQHLSNILPTLLAQRRYDRTSPRLLIWPWDRQFEHIPGCHPSRYQPILVVSRFDAAIDCPRGVRSLLNDCGSGQRRCFRNIPRTGLCWNVGRRIPVSRA